MKQEREENMETSKNRKEQKQPGQEKCQAGV
jgi:hypothetical protein